MAERRRILIVEDEMMVAMLLEDMVRELGYEVVGPAITSEKALVLAGSELLDGAILDVNLGHGERSTGVAETLHARGVPFMFASGYGSKGAIDKFQDSPILKKPFSLTELSHMLARISAPAQR
jgi:DNA-binding response OmpR family regulator